MTPGQRAVVLEDYDVAMEYNSRILRNKAKKLTGFHGKLDKK